MDVKGLALDTSKQAFTERFPHVNCFTSKSEPSREACGDLRSEKYPEARLTAESFETYAGKRTKGFVIILDGGLVSRITVFLDTADFLPVTMSITQKFGKAISDATTVVQNRMGAKFDQQNVMWKQGAEVIVATKRRTEQLDQMEVSLASAAKMEEQAEMQKRRAKEASKDL